MVVALADKLETLVGLFLIGNVPTGDKDPFALRRHAFGVIRMLVENEMNLPLSELILDAYRVLHDWVDVNHLSGEFLHEDDLVEDLSSMMMDRLAGSLREQGFSAQEVDAVLALQLQRLSDVGKRLAAVRAFAVATKFTHTGFGVAPRAVMISTVWPLRTSVRSGTRRRSIFAATQRLPTPVCTA